MRSVAKESVEFYFDGKKVRPEIQQFSTNAATVTTVSYFTAKLACGSTHTNRLVYADSNSPSGQHVKEWVFTVSCGAGETRPPAQPFIREMATGTLLDYFFLSPRPHTWKRDYSLLSGWEVDRRGGTFEFDPNGIFRAGFAFHINWFKACGYELGAARGH